MDTGEINEAVARKLGWIETLPSKTGYATLWTPPEKVDCGKAQWDAPPYSTSIQAAWEILDKWHGDYIVGRQNGKFHCTLFRPSEEFEEWADSAPLAICLAFLKLEGK